MINPKRSCQSKSDMNNNEILSSPTTSTKKKKTSSTTNDKKQSYTIGQIKELRMLNFMCHKNFSIEFHPTPMQIVTGANGSGKSTIANAICLCLGAQARTTGRTTNVQSFIRKGETHAELTITLANEGLEAYKPELYGKEIHIVRRIGAKQSGYKVLGDNHKTISTQKETIAEIIQALSISPENPLCVLHQEVAKTFLLNSDSRKKYQFYMKVSQLDQIRQAYEEAVCTVETITRRLNTMKEKHTDMIRAYEPLDRDVKKIDIRRKQEEKKRELEADLILARNIATQQELTNAQYELDQTQQSKDVIETKINEATTQMNAIDERITALTQDKTDIEKDLYGSNSLQELNYRFSKQKKEIEFNIYRLSRECEKSHQKIKDLELEQIRLRKQIDEYRTLSQQSNHDDELRDKLDQEIQKRQQQQLQWDKFMASFTDDLTVTDDNIRNKYSTIDCIQNELKLKRQEFDELKKIEKDKTNAYPSWMSDCLHDIQNDNRFSQKPIGPIGQYIRCMNAHWLYAVEKHLAPIMTAFICANSHDERILLELFSRYTRDHRPQIYTRKFSDRVPDISGTLDHVRRANLLSIYQVLRIDNITVECALIDYRQIEATILVDNLEHAKRIRQSGVLRWDKVFGKVKQVVEAWTHDGSNVKLDSAFRIYTNDKQPARFFTSNNAQSSQSHEELNSDIKVLSDQLNNVNASIIELKKIRQTTSNNLEKMKRDSNDNKKRMKELNKELDQFNSTMPAVYDYSLEELQDKLREYTDTHGTISKNFDEAKQSKEIQHQELADVTQKFENIEKKIDLKTKECETLTEKINVQQTERQKIQQQELPRLQKKSTQLNEDILKCQEKITELMKHQPKKSKTSKPNLRSVRDIQQELDAINNFLKSNEDTIEKRQQVIAEFKSKRDAARNFKAIYDQCHRQLQRLEKFVYKRKERFGQIADEHKYLLRHKFKDLMEKHQFNDCDINIDHKKEELEIIINHNQRGVASLSGGERSISTFCFLLALWGSIYQPFRLLDEIDIFMDNQKRNLSLELLYENTQYYSSSQHILLTPQSIDCERWKRVNVRVSNIPTPKRSLE